MPLVNAGGDCPSDTDGDGVCDNAEIGGCTDQTACNFDASATEENGTCEYAEADYDCAGNPLNVVEGCTDEGSCTYDAAANTDDGSCEYLDALGDCGGDCAADVDEDGICDNAEVLGCTDPMACNYDEEATEENDGCEYAAEGFDCEGNPLTSSISELTASSSTLTPFPNPSHLGQTVQVLGLSDEGPWTVSLWSSGGKLILQETRLAASQMRGWSLGFPAPNLPGVYFVQVVSPDQSSGVSSTGRLIVH